MTKTRQLDELVNDLDPLLCRLAREHDPEIAALVERVDEAILGAWTAVVQEAADAGVMLERERVVSARKRKFASEWRREQRWLLVGATLILAGVAGLLLRQSPAAGTPPKA